MLRSNKYKYHLNNTYFDSPLSFGKTQILQAGRLYCHPTTEIRAHKQRSLFELTVITSGRGTVMTDGIPTEVSAGEIYLSFPYEEHAIISDEKEPLHYDFFSFMTSDATLLPKLTEIQKKYASPRQRSFRDGKLSALVAEAISELCHRDELSDRMLTHVCEQIEIRIIRAFSEISEEEQKRIADAELLCYEAMSYVDSEVLNIKSLTEVSSALNYNYSYLSDLFKRTTGQTLAEYYRGKRLDVARELLDDGDKSITKIAETLNYSSLYTFSRAFKERFGVSPNQYKRKINS